MPFIRPLISTGTGGSSLLSGLQAWWEMDEADGIRMDSHGIKGLKYSFQGLHAQGGLNCPATGIIDIQPAVMDESFNPQDTAFTIAFWIYPTSVTGNGFIMGHAIRNPGLQSFELQRNTTEFRLVVDGIAGQPNFAFTQNAWQLITIRHDPVADTISMQKNTDAASSSAIVGGLTDVPDGFLVIGRKSLVSTVGPTAGMKRVGWWDRAITDNEVTALYNAGAGLGYADLGGSGPPVVDLRTDLVSWWPFDEPTNAPTQRNDAHGSNNVLVSPNGEGVSILSDIYLQPDGRMNNVGSWVAGQVTNIESAMWIAAGHGCHGGRDFTVGGWVAINTAWSGGVASVGSAASPTTTDWLIHFDTTSDNLTAYVGGVTNWAAFKTHSYSGIATNEWVYVMMEYNDATGVVGISLNGSAMEYSSPAVEAAHVSGDKLYFGAYSGAAIAVCRWDEWFFYDALLDDDQKAAMYNSRAGLSYNRTA